MSTLSFAILPNRYCDDDVYHLCPKNIAQDMEEGSGDSEDASVGAKNEFANSNLNTSQGAFNLRSGKRKRTSGEDAGVGAKNEFANVNLNASQGAVNLRSGKRRKTSGAEKTSKKKATTSSKIIKADNVIAKTCWSSNDVASASIGEVIAEIQNLDKIANDPEWLARCCQLMLFRPAREVFVALRCFEDRRLHWLRHATYNCLPFVSM